MAFAQCLGVPYKQEKAKISLYPCNKENELQKWDCRNSALVIHGANLFLSVGKRKKDNIVLDSGSGTRNKWKIYGTMDDLCSQGYKDLFTLLGNSYGAPCTFPFQLSGKWYAGCTAAARLDGLLWCATTPNFDTDHLYGLCPIAGSPSPEPEKLCAVLNPHRDAKWENRPCEQKVGYICKKENSTLGPSSLPLGLLQCPEGWLPYAGQCYIIHREPRAWKDALMSCNESNADLASIHSPEEHAFILSQPGYKAMDELWIGMNDLSTQMYFEWSDETPVTYTKWLPGEPTHSVNGQEDCVVMAGEDGYWADSACDRKLGYICRREPLQGVSGTPKTDPACTKGWTRHGSYCYLVGHAPVTFSEAMKTCERMHGYLATIEDRYEQAFLTSFVGLSSEKCFWIGLSNTEEQGIFKWETGEGKEVGCVALRTGNAAGLWDVQNCEVKAKFLCKKLAEKMTRPFAPGKNSNFKCPLGWNANNSTNSCFRIFVRENNRKKTWFEARDFCREIGGDLAAINSEEEQRVIEDLITWVDGSNLHYAAWAEGEPNFAAAQEHCVVLDKKYAFLTYHLKDVLYNPWIGLNDLTSELDFVWADGSAPSYTNWAPDCPKLHEPILYDSLRPEDGHNRMQYDCVSMKRDATDTGKWSDEQCFKSSGYICQKNSDPKLFKLSTTVLDFAFDHSDGISYSVTHSKMNWEEAKQSCNSNSSELASILDPYSQSLLFLIVQEYGEPMWIGLNSYTTEGKYQWIDRWRLVYSKWSSGEPKQTFACVYLDTDGTWKTTSCKEKLYSICKKSDGDYTEANFLAETIKILHGKSPNFWIGLKRDNR
ncbi:hypothetical protein ASZ78_015224, partial [Callipepla squamata]